MYASSTENNNDDYPDMYFILKAQYPNGTTVYDRDRFALLTSMTRPLSYGKVELASRNWKKAVKLDPNYLSNSSDTEKLIDG